VCEYGTLKPVSHSKKEEGKREKMEGMSQTRDIVHCIYGNVTMRLLYSYYILIIYILYIYNTYIIHVCINRKIDIVHT
jgi:hypothetical protein